MESVRQRQVAALMQRSFSEVLREEGVYLYGDVLVTVTEVRMTPDLSIARIYLSIYNALHKEVVIRVLEDNIAMLRHELAQRIRKKVRVIPALQFFIDDSLDRVEHLEEILKKVRAEERSWQQSDDADK
jgi:ribosome-binding factor A